MERTTPVNNKLVTLEKWLDYELSASVLLFLSWMWVILLAIVILAVVALAPFMIKVLYEEKKYKWITSFFILIILPAVVIILVNADFLIKVSLLNIPLVIFFLYCFALKFAVKGWIADRNFMRSELE